MNRILIFLIVLAVSSFAQKQPKFPVELSHSGNDITGGRLAYAIKERIRQSQSMEIAYEEKFKMLIILVTLEKFEDSPGTSSIYSVIYCYNYPGSSLDYITSFLGFCGSSKVDEVAEKIVADADKQIEEVYKILNSGDSKNN